jgi:hypothetical protein
LSFNDTNLKLEFNDDGLKRIKNISFEYFHFFTQDGNLLAQVKNIELDLLNNDAPLINNKTRMFIEK